MMSENRNAAILNPAGLLFKMDRDHFGTIPVEVTGDSPQPKPTFPPGGEQPAIHPGSDTYPLEVSAAWSQNGKTLTFPALHHRTPNSTSGPQSAERNLCMRDGFAAWRPIPSTQPCRGTGSLKFKLKN
jgi:hypothetical protein